jgi:Fic family protein
MPFSVNVILQLHSIMYRYMPANGGHWKMTDNEIVERNSDGEIIQVRFKPASAVTTPQAMDELTSRFKAAVVSERFEPLVLVPLAILDLLCIHPFTDGNGRTSRLCTLQLLYHFGYEVGRYISIERIFEESKDSYYETLHLSSQNWHEGKHDVYPWINYFWGVLLRAYQEFEERVGTIQKGRGSKTDQVAIAIENRISSFTISDIENTCPGVSRELIRKVLRQLRDNGKIKSVGLGRGAKWKKIDER